MEESSQDVHGCVQEISEGVRLQKIKMALNTQNALKICKIRENFFLSDYHH